MIPFTKMHGLGNDFVIFDLRREQNNTNFSRIAAKIPQISNRQFGIGCDQVVVILKSQNINSDCFVVFFNSDGTESSACGNATRCVAEILEKEECVLQTKDSFLKVKKVGSSFFQVNMGPPKELYSEIPVIKGDDSKQNLLNYANGVTKKFLDVSFANFGNPHCVFLISSKLTEDEFYTIGKHIESNTTIFPQRVNVEFAIEDKNLGENSIFVMVYERGSGRTLACGTGACASGYYMIKNKNYKSVKVFMEGSFLCSTQHNYLLIEQKNKDILMSGPCTTVFSGFIG